MMVGSADAEAVAEGVGLVGDAGVEAEVAAADAVVLCGAGAVSGVEAEHAAKDRPKPAAKKISTFLSVIIINQSLRLSLLRVGNVQIGGHTISGNSARIVLVGNRAVVFLNGDGSVIINRLHYSNMAVSL